MAMTNRPVVLYSKVPTRLMLALVGAITLLIGGLIGWLAWWRPEVRAERCLAQARKLQSTPRHSETERAALMALELNPELAEARLIVARSAAEQHQYDRAISHLRQISSGPADVRLRAAMLAAELNWHHLHRLFDAEQAYRVALELDPDSVEANSQLAKLLSICGRIREAVPLALRLVNLGEQTDFLVLLASEYGVVKAPQLVDQARQANPGDPNLLMCLAWHAGNAGQTAEAIALLRNAVEHAPNFVPAHVALGQQLLAAGEFAALNDWINRIPIAADAFAETWFVRAGMAENVRDIPGAIRCYWEGLRRAPESRAANAHIARLLAESGSPEISGRFARYLRRLQDLENVQNRLLHSRDRQEVGTFVKMAECYEAAGRLWEAYGWCRIAVEQNAAHAAATQYLKQLKVQVHGLPFQLVQDNANVALLTDLSAYPLPQFRDHPSSSGNLRRADSSTKLSFRDEPQPEGFDFRYFNGVDGPPTRRMFEFTGGGMGVIDFDMDGFCDLFCTQGCPWPPGVPVGEYSDRLFRNHDGSRFEDITIQAGILEVGFGQGVTVGDFNSDGFADVYVANIGSNQLWANNGDGTFTDVTRVAEVGGNEWTTSCVLADLNGDGFSDIYAVNYVTADDVFDRVCRHGDGAPKLCRPYDFRGQSDHLWLNDGDGHFRDATSTELSTEPTGMGLGVAVWDAHGKQRLSLLVANDTTPNFFFVSDAGQDGHFQLRECGIETGLALSGDGMAKGCMGIALGDVDGDGRIDVNITNFLGESNTLYLNSATLGFFEDRTQAMGLRSPTARVLGFGTQFLDIDLDGQLELFMTNGHVDDSSRAGVRYRMPPLVFRQQHGRFVAVAASELGKYFQENWLGRSAVRLDWNRDGRDDLAVGHLYDRSMILTNTTPPAGRYLSIRPFGVQSNRDAIGTTLHVRLGKQSIMRQLTAGDGYHASNERRINFGVGAAQTIDELEVRWPSGLVQRFENLPTSQELLLVEGRNPVSNR